MLGNLADIVSFSRHLVHWTIFSCHLPSGKLKMRAKKKSLCVRINEIGRVKVVYTVSKLCPNPLSLLRENGSGNSLNLSNCVPQTPEHSYGPREHQRIPQNRLAHWQQTHGQTNLLKSDLLFILGNIHYPSKLPFKSICLEKCRQSVANCAWPQPIL